MTLNKEPWRTAVCLKCDNEIGWRNEYTGGRFWVVYTDGDHCRECNIRHHVGSVQHKQTKFKISVEVK